jgi:hypothetical protein
LPLQEENSLISILLKLDMNTSQDRHGAGHHQIKQSVRRGTKSQDGMPYLPGEITFPQKKIS